MLNRHPIFLNCFTQGGSNILWNIVVSHPDVASPTTEMHSCFENGVNFGMRKNRRRLSWINFSWSGLALLALTRQPRFFDVRNVKPRRRVGRLAERIIDARLFAAKQKSIEERGFRYKDEGHLYSPEEIRGCRLCTKGNNGLIFVNPVLRRMYGSARFLAMARHPLPVYESWSRRGIVTSPDEFCAVYNPIARRMAEDGESADGHLVRFEDLLGDPAGTARAVYDFVGLDFDVLKGFRLKAKKHYRSDGTYGTNLNEGEYYWFQPEELSAYLESGVSRRHIEALDPVAVAAVLEQTRAVRDTLGYADTV